MGIMEDMQKGDVYLDYPAEDVKFRWEKQSARVFRRFYGEVEVEVGYTSKLFRDAMSAGNQITREEYFAD